LGRVKRYPSLEAAARDVRKPMFELGPADGALGSQLQAAQQAYRDFSELADRIADATWRPAAPAAVTSPA
jgi:hypothetical protein